MWGVRVKAGDIMVICAPTSPNDGKRVRVLQPSHGYNMSLDAIDPDTVNVEILDTGKIGGIHKRFLSEVK